MSKYIYILVLFLAFFKANANNANVQIMDSAAQYYANGKFEKAAAEYEKILSSGFESAQLYYNLGNCYFKSNKIAQSIVNYERAKKLMPTDEDVLFNLNLANTYVVDKIDVVPEFFLSSWWNRFVQILSSNQWAYISLGAFVLGVALLLMFFLLQQVMVRKVSFWFGVVLVLVSIFAFSFSAKQKWIAQNEPEAIIQTPSIVVKSSPSEGGTELFLIHEGLKIKVTDKLNNWIEIRLPDGNKGWVKKSDVVVI